MNKPHEQLKCQRRQSIISAAGYCFSRAGFHGTSMAEIIEATGLSAGQIYRYFPGKNIIVNECIIDITERWQSFMVKNLPEQNKTDDIINIHSDFWREWTENDRRLLIETYSEASRSDAARVIVNNAEKKLFDTLESKFHEKFPGSTLQQRSQQVEFLLLLADGVTCRSFIDDSLNKNELARINNIFHHHVFMTPGSHP